jgi:hypothetical protein
MSCNLILSGVLQIATAIAFTMVDAVYTSSIVPVAAITSPSSSESIDPNASKYFSEQ